MVNESFDIAMETDYKAARCHRLCVHLSSSMRDQNQGVLMKKIPRLISHTHRFYWYSFQNENNLIRQTGGRKLTKID